MKMNIRPVHLGLFLVLSLFCVATPVVSQQVSCETSDDCPDETYCAAGGFCLIIGGCNEVADCNNPSNGPYPVALCIGTTICEQGGCGVDCSQAPPEPVEKPPVTCSTSADCPDDRDGQYCASDGICEPIGGCAVPDDCFNDENSGFPIATCMGGMMCNDRRCQMDCSGGSDALFMCETSDDCPEPETYCNTYGHCRKNGSCDIVDDCSVFDNTFPRIECVGRQYCENFTCGIACGEMPIDTTPGNTCATNQDCDLGDYCAGNGLCLPGGSCDRDKDCFNVGNSFMSIGCVGTTTCESGMCTKSCNDVEAETPTCTTSDDCGMHEYCASNGMCLSNGACDKVEDCNNMKNLFMAVTCVGTVSCDAGMCSKTCDTAPVDETKVEDGSPVVVDMTSCSSDSDCVALSSARTVDNLYCSQGVCMKHGTCQSDTDCINPSNWIWGDKKCSGYLYCTETGTCDRVCGRACKNGSRAAECFADPCDVETMCEEAVSCMPSYCDGECKAMFFGAAGEVVECGNPIGGMEASRDGSESNIVKDVDASKSEEGSPATMIQSTISALLAAVLVATAVVV